MNGVGYGITPFMGSHGILARSAGGGVVPFVNEYSMTFDGNLDYFTVSDNDNLSFGNGTTDSPFSISSWVKMNDATRFRIVGKYDSNLEYLFSTSGTDKIVFNCYDDSTNAKIGRLYNTALTSFEGQWIHLVATYNGSSSSSGLKIYLNGSRVDDTDSNSGTYTAMENTTAPLEIGKNLTTYANGLIDETAIFNAELSASDVTTIYNSGAPTDLTSLSPLSWWRMGDGDTFSTNWTLIDNGSGGNDATSTTLPESARLPITANSYSQNSFVFNGIDDFVTMGNPTDLQITGSLSLSAWVKTSNNSQIQTIIGKDGVSTGTRSYLLNLATTGEARFFVFKSGSNTSVFSTTQINDGNWHHVLCVNDGADLKIYIDGTLENTTVGGGGTMLNGTSYFAIGRREANTPSVYHFFDGNIDEVYVWNNDQSGNISTIYGNGVPTDISSINPLGHWRFGETDTFSTSWTIVDQGSGGNNGTSTTLPESAKTGDQPYVL